MPELPEVETIRKTLKQFVLNKTIDHVDVHWGKIIKRPDDLEQFKMELVGQTIHDILRKGKFLLFQLDDYVLVSHLRMEGKYRVTKSSEPLKKHTHIIFSFTNGEELRYNDVRKFGTMHLFKKGEEMKSKPLNLLGPDPFDPAFTTDYFINKLKKTERVIKSALLDQGIVAGLGNIYVDETLFRAGVHPLRQANKLTHKEITEVRKQAIVTIQEAVKQGGTTIRSYVNGQGEMGMFQQELFVYGQEDKACKKCGKQIIKMKIGGRGTHICTTCQLLKR
ncbi:DNA-formamidopyrimidine glycosylase [Agaribacter marinus]|uniref:Formamidopyrimidine-DNA glycosylase n=1 Tax=Virgibacillus salarius TaxID=447199 RepID=A0A941DRM8_9BACI|nr:MULTISPECIES: DNA-formamidopyrimidine glycosylase [Virgibacillus]MBR7795804.1 DNA-formamidopyrimidine glycosylase [Virgibacillus salarius]MDY7044249.1 DNA-formamidopyrimidine glycosylase [Virgibacillus sp. M23]NAZ08517.1 DNA-formamidopyrimidine glycosylase [Agaribacter marinus]WBX78933.1 DNA-formamidopyrimidine glycosylase [Virgibacillus salarius]